MVLIPRQVAFSTIIAAGIAAIPFGSANAQYCSFPLEWPFCIAGAAVGTAATIATAPFRAVTPYYYYGSPSYYYGPYYGPVYYGPRYRYWRRHRHHRYHY